MAGSLSQTLDQLALLASIRGDRTDAELFTRASVLVRARGIESDADLGPLLDESPSLADPDLLRQLRYMFEAGGWVLRESAIADLPADLRWLYESGAVTLEQLAAIHSLGITATADLLDAVERQTLRQLPGFDSSIERSVAAALPNLRTATPRISLGRAAAIADPILACLRSLPAVDFATPAGSLRRGSDTVSDIEIVAPAANPTTVFDALLELPDIARTLHRSERRLYLLTDRVQVGIRCPTPDVAGAALLHMTGSIAHLSELRALAKPRGWTLTADGLFQAPAAPLSDSEETIYGALDLPWIPPEIREGRNEIAAAQRGALPTLVTRADIKGDLHMHTEWSDGRDTIADMVHACAALGYQYLAITDHSPHSSAARSLTIDGVKRQADEIARLREEVPHLVILHGCEVDILPNGRLDFPDRILERFDIVLASLHERAGHAPPQLFQRYLTAMRHPLVSVITHPTNRQVPQRPGYDLDYSRLFAAAAETGTAVEIDGAPSHLDLNGVLARQAVAAGAMLTIDSDGHRAEMLGRQMDLAVLMARNGWVETRDVLNTRPIAEVRERIAAKRRR